MCLRFTWVSKAALRSRGGERESGKKALVEVDFRRAGGRARGGGLTARASVSVLREEIDAVGVAFSLRVLLRSVSSLLRSDDEDCAKRHVVDEREREREIV